MRAVGKDHGQRLWVKPSVQGFLQVVSEHISTGFSSFAVFIPTYLFVSRIPMYFISVRINIF